MDHQMLSKAKREQPSILFSYEPELFWAQLRAVIKEELANLPAPKVVRASEQFLPRVEVARMLRVSLVTLNTWVKKGMPAHKQSGKVYFLQSEVLDYIKSRAPQGG